MEASADQTQKFETSREHISDRQNARGKIINDEHGFFNSIFLTQSAL